MDKHKYLEIENYIIKKIRNEEFQADEKLPSELDLAKQFNVSRMTARKAFENLMAKNYLYKVERRGTFVKGHHDKEEVFLDNVIGLDARMKKRGKQVSTEIIKFDKIIPDKLVQKKMKLSDNEEVYYIKRLRFIDKEPFTLELNYIPVKYGEITKKDIKKSLHSYREERGFHVKRIKKEFLAVVPDAKIKNYLKITNNVAVFKVEYLHYVENKELFQYSKVYYNQNQFRFVQITDL